MRSGLLPIDSLLKMTSSIYNIICANRVMFNKRLLLLFSGIVIGVLLLAVLVAGGVFVALKGVPEPVKNVFSNSKEAVDASAQFQHSNLETPATGDV